jgi:hypothetical protein
MAGKSKAMNHLPSADQSFFIVQNFTHMQTMREFLCCKIPFALDKIRHISKSFWKDFTI